MNIVDILIIAVLLIYIAKGFSNGVIKELVSFVGGLAVIIIAFLLKNPVSVFMYKTLPFIKFSGLIKGITVLNIVVYELLAFLIVAAILLTIYHVTIRMTSILETILKLTIVLALPSKILGAVIGLIEGILISFILLFVCMQVSSTREFVVDSKYGNAILAKTPILSSAIAPVYDSLQEIYEVADKYDDMNRDTANLECLDILLKYKVLDVKNADALVESGKLDIDGIEQVIDKYRTNQK